VVSVHLADSKAFNGHDLQDILAYTCANAEDANPN
jgi:hypothetical protein